MFFSRLEPGESYFDRLPDPINDIGVHYDIPCSCHREDYSGKPECLKKIPVHFPNVLDETGAVVIVAGAEGERKKRDILYSDDLTDEDFDLFKQYAGSDASHRLKRALLNEPKFTKENATLYCIERISNTGVGKSCAKLGVNVQAMINSCAIDLEVKCYIFLVFW